MTIERTEYSRPVSDEEQARVEAIADQLIPLCSVRDCGKVAGHEDDHGPVVFDFERRHILTRGTL